jgi:hypothetical protein
MPSILLVGMPNSIHVARWIRQIAGQGWQLYLYPATAEERRHPDLEGVEIIRLFFGKYDSLLRKCGLVWFARMLDWLRRHYERRNPDYRAACLVRIIKRLQPDLVHSMEIQGAGYLTLTAKKRLGDKFPKWLVTNWGSDIYLFGRLKAHRRQIQDLLAGCDFYSAECERDIALARSLGFAKTPLPIFPNTGGYDLDIARAMRGERTSRRRTIMLKGYQNWAGRALVGLRALERCEELLRGYKIVIFSASEDVKIAAELFSERNAIETVLVPHNTAHADILAWHGRARISMGLSISDGISTSLLESMVMGSFPIQSCTACADEWIENGVSGLIVSPEDVDLVELAIRQALSDDEMVDMAAERNWKTTERRLDKKMLNVSVCDMYRTVLAG